jgi:hypothetical protein
LLNKHFQCGLALACDRHDFRQLGFGQEQSHFDDPRVFELTVASTECPMSVGVTPSAHPGKV